MTRILLIDDDDQVRTMLRLMLVHHGHTVTEAPNGRDGLKRFERSEFDLVITDLVMPEKEGIEVVKDLREKHPLLKIIAISGGGLVQSAEDYLVMARRLGANIVLAKPFAHAALLAAIDELLPTDPVGVI